MKPGLTRRKFLAVTPVIGAGPAGGLTASLNGKPAFPFEPEASFDPEAAPSL